MDIFSTVFITYITLLLNHLNKVSTKVSIYMYLHIVLVLPVVFILLTGSGFAAAAHVNVAGYFL